MATSRILIGSIIGAGSAKLLRKPFRLEGHTDCAYIYDHVISIPCDQRYTAEDMAYICRVLKDF